MPAWLKTIVRYITLGATAALTFVVALILARKKGSDDAEARLEKETRLKRIEEAGARGDTDALDEEWRER
jgi:uncharacterized membrane protein YdjX (TVP38/TMEM64 family)